VANAGVRGRPIEPLVLSAQERTYLERQVRRHRVARSLSERCRAILRCADGLPSKSVAAELRIHEHTVGKRHRRFLKDRCDGLLDEARPGRPRTIKDDQLLRLSSGHCVQRRPTRRTGRSARWLRKLAFLTLRSAECGRRSACSRTAARHLNCRAIRYSSIRCVILSGFTCPHRTEPLSSASMRRARYRRSQPVLPMMPGIPERRTHSYVRHRRTTLFAALDVASGFVIGKCYKRHRAVEFLQSLKEIDAQIPEGLAVHIVMNNDAAHKTPKIKAWLARRTHYHVHFTPTSASWINQIERWFA
jgi:hypothetical protein